jgi:hypothetical protein
LAFDFLRACFLSALCWAATGLRLRSFGMVALLFLVQGFAVFCDFGL